MRPSKCITCLSPGNQVEKADSESSIDGKAEVERPVTEPVRLSTKTVYGFLDFTTTVGDTVMIFKPSKAPGNYFPLVSFGFTETVDHRGMDSRVDGSFGCFWGEKMGHLTFTSSTFTLLNLRLGKYCGKVAQQSNAADFGARPIGRSTRPQNHESGRSLFAAERPV